MEDHSVCNLTSSDVDDISEETVHPAGQLPQAWEFSELRTASEAGREIEGGASVASECNIDPVDDMISAASALLALLTLNDNADDISAASDHPAVVLNPKGRHIPNDVVEHIFSYMPAPSLCKYRSVSKGWKKRFGEESFLDKWDQNGGQKEYLFVTRYFSIQEHCDLESCADDAYWRTTCFFDLEADPGPRWYSYSTGSAPEHSLLPFSSGTYPLGLMLRHLGVDDGLICQFVNRPGGCGLDMVDPVARQRWEVPNSPEDYLATYEFVWGGEVPHVIVSVVNNADRSFKVFLMARRFGDVPDARLFKYESSNQFHPWHELPIDLQNRGHVGVRNLDEQLIGESAVFFRGDLYIAVRDVPRDGYLGDTIIVSYTIAEDLWREVLAVGVQHPQFPQLIVSRGRMFLAVWSAQPDDIHCSYFEIKEIFVDPSSSNSVVIIPYENLRHISGEDGYSIQWGYPLDSDSVLLLTRRSGRLLTYDLRSRAVGVLPPHPVHPSEQDALLVRQGRLFPHYRGRLSKLSLRNILSGFNG